MTIMFFLPYFNTLVTETLNIFSWNISLHSSNIIFFCSDLQKIPL